MSWKKLTQDDIKERIYASLAKNVNYIKENVIGIPASYLDTKVFSQDSNLLKESPFLQAMVWNPNHIGCHTLNKSESFFKGTQEIEREVISICAKDIMHAEDDEFDGYVASGGTEANIQAIWIYRNYFLNTKQARHCEIAIVCSSDSHYSMNKAANLLNIDLYSVPTNEVDKNIDENEVDRIISQAQSENKKYFIVIANMMTTMFGSVDNMDAYTNVLNRKNLDFKLHIDAAFGGFYYPFSCEINKLNFDNPLVSSITMDAHKMAQAPYGTGIFIIRKGFMQHASTKEASYVKGEDSTLIGSRSGANAIAIWMILCTYGKNGWFEKIYILQKRTEWFCEQLTKLKIPFYRNPFSNIVTIKSQYISFDIAEKFGLVPDNHNQPEWFKVVVMEHVSIEKLELLIEELKLPV